MPPAARERTALPQPKPGAARRRPPSLLPGAPSLLWPVWAAPAGAGVTAREKLTRAWRPAWPPPCRPRWSGREAVLRLRLAWTPTRTPVLAPEPSTGGPAWPALPHSRRSMPDAAQPPAGGPEVAPAGFPSLPPEPAMPPRRGPARLDCPGPCRLPWSWRQQASRPPGCKRRQPRSCTSRRRRPCCAGRGGTDARGAACWRLPVRALRRGGPGRPPLRRAMPRTWRRNFLAAQTPAAQVRVATTVQDAAPAAWGRTAGAQVDGQRRSNSAAVCVRTSHRALGRSGYSSEQQARWATLLLADTGCRVGRVLQLVR